MEFEPTKTKSTLLYTKNFLENNTKENKKRIYLFSNIASK